METARVIAGPQLPSTVIGNDVTIVPLAPSYSYGRGTPGAWEKLDPETDVKVGDVIRINYRLRVPFLETWQSKFLVDRLANDDRYALRSYALNEEISRLTVELEVLQPASPAILIALAVAAVVAGGLIFIATDSIERLSTVQIGTAKVSVAPLLVLGGLAVAGLYLWGRLKG
jgi:hypothetical protein